MAVQPDEWNAIAIAAKSRVESWLAVLVEDPSAANAARDLDRDAPRADLLEGARRDADGLAFTRNLLDAVLGVSDPFAAALSLRDAARDMPASMPVAQRFAVRAGGLASLGLPWAVLPVARRWLRERVSHLVLSAKLPESAAETAKLASLRSVLRDASAELPVQFALGGIEVLGEAGARRERDRLMLLAAQPEVQQLAVNVSRLVPQRLAGEWALDSDAEQGAEVLRALLEHAEAHGTAITLEASDYRSALLVPRLLVEALRQPGLASLRVGIVLPAELPESLQTAEALLRLSASRVAGGAVPIELTVGVVGLSGREQIASTQSGLAVPVIERRDAQTTQLLRLLELVLRAGSSVRAAVASEDMHVLAAATVLAERIEGAAPLTLQLRAGVVSRSRATALRCAAGCRSLTRRSSRARSST